VINFVALPLIFISGCKNENASCIELGEQKIVVSGETYQKIKEFRDQIDGSCPNGSTLFENPKYYPPASPNKPIFVQTN
jgi:hypothetical protein